jgi:23S rRNA pseudouridine1911/1915/1917 synthase
MNNMGQISPNSSHQVTIEGKESIRIDRFLPSYFTGYSRNFFQKLIEHQHIQLNGLPVTKPSITVKEGDQLNVHFPPLPAVGTAKPIPDNIAVDIVYEHEHFLIISKPASLMVHRPTSTSTVFTLVDWLMACREEFEIFNDHDRPGIVHRLDKDTSGLMIIARNPYAQAQLSNLFKQRAIHKTYLAVVEGRPESAGTIDFPIGRDPLIPTKMTHRYGSGRQSLTHYHVQTYLDKAALVEARPVTGRTHQLRVHFAGLEHPLIGDVIYGKASKLIKRQALHAWKLSFTFEGVKYEFNQEPPADFKALVAALTPNN